jgi:protein-export membrane protein SecD
MKNLISKLFQSGTRARVWRMFFLIIILAMIGGLISGGNYYNQGADWLGEKTGINLPHVKEVPFRLGLDLQGGSHLVYRADMSQVEAKDQVSALEGVRDVIERRVNKFGVSEPVVQTNISGGEHRIIVELAGIKDVKEAITMIGETPLLEFKEQEDTLRELSAEEEATITALNEQTEAMAEEAMEKIKAGEDFANVASEYTQENGMQEEGGDLGWMTETEGPDIVAIVGDFEPGEYTTEILQENGTLSIYKLEDKRFRTNPFDETQLEKEVEASHILICFEGSEQCTSGLSREEAESKINEIKAQANAYNFATLAQENSTGPSGPNGGQLGWFTHDMMVAPFADAAYDIAVGEISDVVETDFGFHLIYKEDERNIEEYHVRRIAWRWVTEADIIGEDREWKNTELTGKNLKRAVVQFNPDDNTPEVGLEFDSEGADMFAEITDRNVGKPVGIFLDGYVISSPNVYQKILGGRAVISGRFNIQEAKLLVQRLNAGALPVPIELINQQTVGATLGHNSLMASLKAGLIGLLLVALFVILYYRLPGLLAVMSLLIYGVLILAIFKIWPVTLTLAGMAGFILSIGMAVDANVLIFERLREEIADGKPLSLAVEDSFNRAWPSIRDGNVSTLLTCFILAQFSTSIVKGFAITLGLGVLISMFSAIVITKTLLQLIGGGWLDNKKWLVR